MGRHAHSFSMELPKFKAISIYTQVLHKPSSRDATAAVRGNALALSSTDGNLYFSKTMSRNLWKLEQLAKAYE